MEFGRVPDNELDKTDFSLPPEPAVNRLILKEPFRHPKVYLGCTNWGRKEWIGKIYPKGIRDASFLGHYVKHYNSIELNATHYQVYGPEAIGKWAAKAAGKEFKFCPKVPQIISHYSGFNDVEQLTTDFLKGILAFGEHLGPVFLQVSEKYHPIQRDKLFSYLHMLPTDLQFFVEVRHPHWFADAGLRKELFDTLRSLKMGAVITDTAGRRDVCHMELTIPTAFIRFVGNNLHKTDYTRIDAWTERIKYWLEQGLHELYFFMHMRDEALVPELTVYLVDKLNTTCGLDLVKPQFVQRQGSLFD
jgi:uncharacterized protein YecE (DUF72 family)